MKKDYSKQKCFITLAFLLITTVVLLGRLFYLEYIDRSFLLHKSEEQRAYAIPLYAQRGEITDKNGRMLAISVPAFNIYADTRFVVNKEKTAAVISGYFKTDYNDILKKLGNKYYCVLVENVDKKTLDDFLKIKPIGISYYKTDKRVYPENMLLGKEIGFIGSDRKGMDGIELFLDKYLKGLDGKDSSEKDKYGNSIENNINKIKQEVDGYDVSLTIDENIQYQVEKYLKQGVEDSKAKRGIAILINPQNGSVYSIADYPNYNPNDYKNVPTDDYFIPSVSMAYEPGSTFKPVTVSIAEDLGLINDAADRFTDNNSFTVDGHIIHAWNHEGFGSQTVVQVLQNSSNAGAAQIGLRIPVEDYKKYLKAFGFGTKTGIEIAGEGNSILQPDDEFKKNIVRANTAMGQGIAITPIQLAKAECIVVNGGKSINPHIVDKITDKNGVAIRNGQRQEQEQVIKKETSLKVAHMLQQVVENGTGRAVKIDGYEIGGKTGTAEKAENGIYSTKHVVSFMGFCPVENPQVLCLVVLDEPENFSASGGTNAAPVVKNIFQYSLPYLGIKSSIKTDKSTKIDILSYLYKTKDFVKKYPPKIPYVFKGEGNIITDQQYVSENGNTSVEFILSNMIKDNYIEMPDLTGLSYKELQSLLKDKFKCITVNGDASKEVKMQSISPGEKVSIDKKIVIWMY